MLLSVVGLVFAGVASGSVKQGDTELDFLGSFQMLNGNQASDQQSLSLEAGLGYFMTDNLQAGIFAGAGWEKQDTDAGDDKTNTYDLGVFAKYHFMPTNQLVPYVGARLGWTALETDPADGDDGNFDGLEYGPLAGLRYELNEYNDLFVEYRYTLFTGDFDDGYDDAHGIFFGIIHQFK